MQNKTYNKQNLFIFNYNIDFNYLIIELEEIKQWYNNELSLIKNLYASEIMKNVFNNSLYISNKHSELIHNMINKILKIINEKRSYCAFLSNSFARGSNLFESDIDLNFVYEDNSMIDFEELVSFCIMFVIDKYRDFIHDSFSHRFSKILNHNQDVYFKLFLNNKTLDYKITKGNEKVMINHCFGNNTFNYYKESLIEKSCYTNFYEYIYYQKNIYNKDKFNELFDNLFIYEKETINIDSFKKLIIKIISDYKQELKEFEFLDISNIKTFKHYYKNIAYNKIFTVIAAYKRHDIYIGKKLSLENIYNYQNKELNEYKTIINNYFGSIMQFAYLCYELNIGFRTRYDMNTPELLQNEFIKINNICFEEYFYKKVIEIYKESICMLERLYEIL